MTAHEWQRIWRASVRQYFAPLTWVLICVRTWLSRLAKTNAQPTKSIHKDEGRT